STAAPGWTAERGFGALDVARLLARASGAPTDHAEIAVGRTTLEPTEPLSVVVRADGDRAALRWGDRVLEVPLSDGVAWARLELPRGATPLVVEATVDGRPLDARTVSRVPDRRRPTAPAGGCALAPSAGSPSACLVLGCLVLIFFRRSPCHGTRAA
ncbi:MAG: hypothetical protein KC619_23240, partial [Myxococcales bacterium]|nr:hypothetical protein [Myxococcales bacterium]